MVAFGSGHTASNLDLDYVAPCTGTP
jgi:hypothetical protein